MDLTVRNLVSPERARLMGAACLAVLAGGVVGWLVLRESPFVVLAALAFPLGVVAFLRSIWVGLVAVTGVSALLPYAVIPAGTAVTPALLEVATLAVVAALAAVVLLDRRIGFPVGAEMAWLGLLLGFISFAFLLGLGRGYTPQTLHDFFKFLLAFLSFWVVLQLVWTRSDVCWMVGALIALPALAAMVGVALYVAGPAFTERVLVRLVPYGYPGSRIVRYIEDDPGRPMRAVGTSVDPNSFGGLLMIGFVLSVGQLLVPRRILPVPVAGVAAALSGSAMLLTYSRGAWVGAVAGVGIVVLLRRRWLIVPSVAAGAAIVAVGVGSGFVERLWLGFTLQDPATRLRLSEYRNAWEIIQRHPWFGVGFGDAPSIELQTGVSSIYLTIAQRAGLLGLAIFLILVGLIAWRGLRQAIRDRARSESDTVVCVLGVLVAMLTVGLVDHYFFNPQFPHMATLFWTVAGLVVALGRVMPRNDRGAREQASGAVSSAERDRFGIRRGFRTRRAGLA